MITPRLEMILRHVCGDSVTDIGTDHAYIPIILADRGFKVIATDISTGPLKSAEENIKKYNKDIELRLGSGLKPIKCGETDSIIIAGMGGELIEKILSENPEKAKNSLLLLQPMNSQYELRKFLINSGYSIINEDLAAEGHKIYNLIIADSESNHGGGENVCVFRSDIDFHLPPCLYYHKLFDLLLKKKEREFSKIYSGLCASANGGGKEAEKYAFLLSELKKIAEIVSG